MIKKNQEFKKINCVEKRDINGILLIDKPIGYSSNHILQIVKKIYNAKKAGHTGSLDPLATGMLPICFGEATKFSQYLLNSDKSYYVVARLGQSTDTCDADGKIISEQLLNFHEKKLKNILNDFQGHISQIPSMYSALKYKGVPLYKYARKGLIIPRKKRNIIIHNISLICWKKKILKLQVCCSKGTYIRTLIDDIGKKLGCGAHVIALRRIQVANYNFEKMVKIKKIIYVMKKHFFCKKKLEKKMDSLLLPINSCIDHYPKIHLSLEEFFFLKIKKRIKVFDIIVPGLVQIFTREPEKFMGIAEVDCKSYIIARHLISMNTMN